MFNYDKDSNFLLTKLQKFISDDSYSLAVLATAPNLEMDNKVIWRFGSTLFFCQSGRTIGGFVISFQIPFPEQSELIFQNHMIK